MKPMFNWVELSLVQAIGAVKTCEGPTEGVNPVRTPTVNPVRENPVRTATENNLTPWICYRSGVEGGSQGGEGERTDPIQISN